MKLFILILKLMITYSLANHNNSTFNCKKITLSKNATQPLSIIKLSDWENIRKSIFIIATFVDRTGFKLQVAINDSDNSQTSLGTNTQLMYQRNKFVQKNIDEHNEIKIVVIKLSDLKEFWTSKYIKIILFNSYVLISLKSNCSATKNESSNASTSLEIDALLMCQMNKEWQKNKYQINKICQLNEIGGDIKAVVENIKNLGHLIRLKFDIINIDITLVSLKVYQKVYAIFILYFLIFLIFFLYFLRFYPLLYNFFEDYGYLLEDILKTIILSI